VVAFSPGFVSTTGGDLRQRRRRLPRPVATAAVYVNHGDGDAVSPAPCYQRIMPRLRELSASVVVLQG
jgi:hypothetical protein